jgi:hypothetical protein
VAEPTKNKPAQLEIFLVLSKHPEGLTLLEIGTALGKPAHLAIPWASDRIAYMKDIIEKVVVKERQGSLPPVIVFRVKQSNPPDSSDKKHRSNPDR